MSSREIEHHIDGEQRAERAIEAIFGDPDAIARSLANILAADGVTVMVTPRLLGWSRRLRKALETSR